MDHSLESVLCFGKMPIPRFVMTRIVGRALEATLEKIDRLLTE
jgi:hypothetical protein